MLKLRYIVAASSVALSRIVSPAPSRQPAATDHHGSDCLLQSPVVCYGSRGAASSAGNTCHLTRAPPLKTCRCPALPTSGWAAGTHQSHRYLCLSPFTQQPRSSRCNQRRDWPGLQQLYLFEASCPGCRLPPLALSRHAVKTCLQMPIFCRGHSYHGDITATVSSQLLPRSHLTWAATLQTEAGRTAHLLTART